MRVIFKATSPTVSVTAPSAPLIRNATEPVASGHHTKCRRAGIRCAHNAAPVLTLKRRVPTNCVAAESHSARMEGVCRDQRVGGLLRISWIRAALVKNQEPMKHSRLVAPAPANMAKPGAVPIANKHEPIANNQHWRRKTSVFAMSITINNRPQSRAAEYVPQRQPTPRPRIMLLHNSIARSTCQRTDAGACRPPGSPTEAPSLLHDGDGQTWVWRAAEPRCQQLL